MTFKKIPPKTQTAIIHAQFSAKWLSGSILL
jgi:hypothetical protein